MQRTYKGTITTPAGARQVRPGTHPLVSLLSDFGARDPSAGIMRAVVLAIAPEANVLDISHEVDKFAVRDGALLLWCAVPYLPEGAHVAVVDPGVGTSRRGIAIESARGDFLVGPDNGILMPAAARLGGIVRVHLLESPQYRLSPMSASFHGRDVFAPAAAHLATGLPIEYVGPPVDPRDLMVLDWPLPDVHEGLLRTSVVYRDTFGNIKLSALHTDLATALPWLRLGEPVILRITDPSGIRDVEATWARTFGAVPQGAAVLYEDSYGRLCLAVNQGDAAAAFGIVGDAEVLITTRPLPPPGHPGG